MMSNQGGYNNSYQADWDPSFSGYVPATNVGFGGYGGYRRGGYGGGFGGFGGGYGGFGRMW